MIGSERRLVERFDVKLRLRVSIPKSAVPEQMAESSNISARGVRFATDLPLKKGTPVRIAFEMPIKISQKLKLEFRCTGHVVHVQPRTSQRDAICVGVMFNSFEILSVA